MTVTPTIVDRLVERAARAPSDVLITLVDDDGQDEGWLTASGLHEAARRVAAHLLGPAGLQPGDRVMLVYLPSLEFVTALAGCLMAGVVAVPVAPPDPIRPGADLARFATLARNAGARHALTHNVYHRARTLGRLRNLVFKPATGWPELNWLVTDALKAPREEVALPRTRPDDSGDPPVHLRIDRDAARRDDHARQPHPPARLQRRRARLPHRRARRHLGPALPRLRPDQRHPQLAAWQRQPVDALAARLHPAPGGLVRGDEPRRRHAHRGAELRLRALDEEDHAGAAARLGPLAARGGDERRRADPAGRRPRLPRRVRAERAAPLGLLPRLRPRRAHRGRVGAWPGDGEGVAAGARARGRCARAGGRRGGEDAGGLRQALAGRDGAGGRSGAARGPRAPGASGRSGWTRRARRPATSGSRRTRSRRSAPGCPATIATISAPAISASSTTARSSSAAGSRT